jgi:branched-chain amino acid transport system permease protein
MDLSVFRPLRRKGSALVLLIASLGFYIALQNIVSMVFGDDTKSIRPNVSRPGFSVFGARITQAQMVIVLSSIALVGAVAVLLDKTKMGKAMRAVANDPDLASVSGVKSDTVILCVFALGSFLAGIAGILASLDVDMRPTMGIGTLMMGVVAMIIGGAESVHGVALGAMFVGLARHFGVWKIGTQWQDAMAFVILLAFLLLRPQGFLGKKVRKATV